MTAYKKRMLGMLLPLLCALLFCGVAHAADGIAEDFDDLLAEIAVHDAVVINNTGGPISMGKLTIPAGRSITLTSMDASSPALVRGSAGGTLIEVRGELALGDIIIDAGGAGSSPALSVAGTLTMRGGSALQNSKGGGVQNAGTFRFEGGRIAGNEARLGAAIYNTGSLTITGGTITGNTAAEKGGAIYNTGSLTVTGGTITKNKAPLGAAIFTTGNVAVGAPYIGTDDGDNGVYLDNCLLVAEGTAASARINIEGVRRAATGLLVVRGAAADGAGAFRCNISGYSLRLGEKGLALQSDYDVDAHMTFDKTGQGDLAIAISPAPRAQVQNTACLIDGAAQNPGSFTYNSATHTFTLRRSALASLAAGTHTVELRMTVDGVMQPFVASLKVIDVPENPEGLKLTPGNGTIAVSWAAQADRYTISWGSAANARAEVAAPITNYTITGLANGQSYTVTVTAHNAQGQSGAATGTATPIGVPTAPQNVRAAADGASIALAFDAPANNGGSAITKYTVTNTNDGKTNSGGGMNYTFGDLAAGTYIFEVRAHNANGASTAATISVAVGETAENTPGAPQNLQAAAGETSLAVSWQAPPVVVLDDAQYPITGYTLRWGGGSVTLAPDQTHYEITGLLAAQHYTVTLSAANAFGAGGTATLSAVTLAPAQALPGAPVNVAAQPGDGKVTITFEPAEGDVAGYRAVCAETAQSQRGGAGQRSFTFTGLDNGTAYTFRVTAITAAGEEESAAAVVSAMPRSVPGAPRNVAARAGDGKVTITLDEPVIEGVPVTGYTVLWKDGGRQQSVSSAERTIELSGLTNGTDYVFEVRADSAAGPGEAVSVAAAPTAAEPGYGAPEAVTGIEVEAGDRAITISFEATRIPATGYKVSGPGLTAQKGSSTRYTFGNLVNGQTYAFTVTPYNENGDGEPVTVSATPRTVPGAPRLSVAAGDGKVTLHITPGSDGGSPVKGYRVSLLGGTPIYTAETVIDFTGLDNGTIYTFQVEAQNAVGSSAPVLASARPQASVQYPPQTLSVAPGETAAFSVGATGFTGLRRGMELVPASAYKFETRSGATHITLSVSYINTLSAGNHFFTALFKGGMARLQLRVVRQSAPAAQGGGDANVTRNTYIYARPSTASDKLLAIGEETPIALLRFSGNFAVVTSGGVEGYVSAEHLSAELAVPIEGSITRAAYAYTRMNTVTARYRAERLRVGDAINIVARRNAWWEYHTTEGETRYILARNVRLSGASDQR